MPTRMMPSLAVLWAELSMWSRKGVQMIYTAQFGSSCVMDAFDARNTSFPSVTPFKQNQYGFTVGGPVVISKLYNGRNRMFFYGGME